MLHFRHKNRIKKRPLLLYSFECGSSLRDSRVCVIIINIIYYYRTGETDCFLCILRRDERLNVSINRQPLRWRRHRPIEVRADESARATFYKTRFDIIIIIN